MSITQYIYIYNHCLLPYNRFDPAFHSSRLKLWKLHPHDHHHPFHFIELIKLSTYIITLDRILICADISFYICMLGKRWPRVRGKTVCSWRTLPWGGGRDFRSRPKPIALWYTICDGRCDIHHHTKPSNPVLSLLPYFLGSEKRVDGCFLKRWSEAEKGRCLRRKKRGRCVHCGSFITDCGHIDQVIWFIVISGCVAVKQALLFCSYFWPKSLMCIQLLVSLIHFSIWKGQGRMRVTNNSTPIRYEGKLCFYR